MRTQYMMSSYAKKLDAIRERFMAPIKHLGGRAVSNDGRSGLPRQINTRIFLGDSLLAVADTRHRSRSYDPMELSMRDGYGPLVDYVKSNPGELAFVIWGFGDALSAKVLIVDPDARVETTLGGRSDRSDPYDMDTMARIPFGWLKTPEEVWRAAGLI